MLSADGWQTRVMADKGDDNGLPDAPELSETAQAIARGRELVEQARRLGEEADRHA